MKSAGKNKRPLPTPSRDAPVFGSPFEQRRLRFLNALFLALARAKRGRSTLRSIRPAFPYRLIGRPRGEGRASARTPATSCVFAILARYDPDLERASWHDGEGDRLERFIEEMLLRSSPRPRSSIAKTVSARLSGACSGRLSWRKRHVNSKWSWSAKRESASNNSIRPGSIGCSMKRRRCGGRPTPALMLMR